MPDLAQTVEEVMGIPVTLTPLGNEVAGAIARKADRVFIFISSDAHPPRRRFTLAHELGHFALGHSGRIDPVATIFGLPRSQEEKDANSFAAELLAPLDGVRRWFETRTWSDPAALADITRCACYFGVSAESMLYRVKEAKLLARGFDALRSSIRSGEHSAIIAALEISEVTDALALVTTPLGATRPPRDLLLRAGRAVAADLIEAQTAAAMLNLDAQKITAAAEAVDLPDEEL